jgi:hypothetical protein
MLNNKGQYLQYLLDYRDGKIKQGLGLGCSMDDYSTF